MRTYRTKAWFELYDDIRYPDSKPRTCDVFEAIERTRQSGVLDAQGNMIYVTEEPNPIGFTAKLDAT